VPPVSAPIANVFRAMKTLREVDEKHSPKIFVKEWSGTYFRANYQMRHNSRGRKALFETLCPMALLDNLY
jgi:hypothetical protein